MAFEAKEAADAELAVRAAAGDRSAFAALVERHYDFVFRLAFRWTGRRVEAEDIAQDVCIRLGKNIRSFRGGAAFTSWLYAVVLNAVRDWSRKAAREALKSQAFAVEMLSAEPAAGGPAQDDPAERLWAAVRRLPDKQREAVTLIYGEGISHAAAADLMACAEATVSWHVHEAKKRLKQIVRHADEEA